MDYPLNQSAFSFAVASARWGSVTFRKRKSLPCDFQDHLVTTFDIIARDREDVNTQETIFCFFIEQGE